MTISDDGDRSPLVLGIDIGTSACKSVLMTPDGRLVATAEAAYPLSTPRPGWAEQDPADWWTAVLRSVDTLVQDARVGRAIVGIGLSGQMHGLVVLDDADTVVRPAMLWCDQRGAPEISALLASVGGTEALLRYTNNPMLPGFTASKLLWLASHQPNVLARTRRFLNPKDFIRLKLTGEYATDVSDASGTGLFDVRARRWADALIERAEFDRGMFPDAFESSEITGVLTRELADRWHMRANVPVVAGGGDSVVQTTSMGVVAAGMTGLTIGTAGIVGGSSLVCPDNPGARLQVSCGNAADRWHVMGVTLNAGGSLQWLSDALAPLFGKPADFDALVELAASVPAGADQLLFAPHLMGERCPVVAPAACGAWVGLTRAHDIRHMTRAVIEGVTMNIRAILDLFSDAGLETSRLRVSGGATKSRFWLQTLADVTGKPLSSVSGAATGGAAGAALLAGIAADFWRDIDDATDSVSESESINCDARSHKRFNELYPAHQSLLATLDGCHAQLASSIEGKMA